MLQKHTVTHAHTQLSTLASKPLLSHTVLTLSHTRLFTLKTHKCDWSSEVFSTAEGVFRDKHRGSCPVGGAPAVQIGSDAFSTSMNEVPREGMLEEEP